MKKETFFSLILSFALALLTHHLGYRATDWESWVIIVLGLLIGGFVYNRCKQD